MAIALVSLIFIALLTLYFYLTKNYNYWQKRKIPCPDGALPGVGHFWDFITMKMSISECCRNIYNNYRNRSMVGVYNFRSPALLVLEPELVKTVLQTNFANFHENGFKINPDLDPLLANNPFFTYGEKWVTVFRTSFLPKKADRFFRTIIADVMEQRRREEKPRNDFLQLMADLERSEGTKIDINVLTSHAVSFFIDGYETSSTVLSFIGFQLASHQDVQAKLHEEVISVLNKYDGVITYDALKDMTYMDQVISETQRVIATVGFLTKICTEETELKGSDGLTCHIERGMQIMIPVQGLQEDPRYWEHPEVFDPDRFSPDRKHNIERFAFLPFGEGPRICVGMRMAQLQMKACLATLLKKYSLELSPKTRVPLKMISSTFLTAAEGGLWVIIRPI
ncbi:hypothetical protein ACFW04_006978 [Cataglyphis niger]